MRLASRTHGVTSIRFVTHYTNNRAIAGVTNKRIVTSPRKTAHDSRGRYSPARPGRYSLAASGTSPVSRMRSSAASSSTGTPSETAFASLLPAASPATT